MRGNNQRLRSKSRVHSGRGRAKPDISPDGNEPSGSTRSSYRRWRPYYSSGNKGRTHSRRFAAASNYPTGSHNGVQRNETNEDGLDQGNGGNIPGDISQNGVRPSEDCLNQDMGGNIPGDLLKNRKPMGIERMLALCRDNSLNALDCLTSMDNAFHRRLNSDEPAGSTRSQAPRECYVLKVMQHALKVSGEDTRVTKHRLIHSFTDSAYFRRLSEEMMKWKLLFRQRQARSVIMLNLNRIVHIFLEILRCSPSHFLKISAIVPIIKNVIDGMDDTAEIGDSIMGSTSGDDSNFCRSIKNMMDDFKNLTECLEDLTAREEQRQAKIISSGKRRMDCNLQEQDDGNLEPPEDFRQLSIVPSLDDIFTDPVSGVFLRKNRVKGSYRDVQNYLDTQFRLLREDFISPLRDGIAVYLASGGKVGKGLLDDIRVYHGGKLIGSVFTKQGDLVHKISFGMTNLKRVKWEISKRFIHGSLLCLSYDNFQSVYFATVFDRVVSDLYKGRLSVICESGFAEFNKLAAQKDIIIVESVAYFEAYRHVLRGLQNFKNSEIPFIEYLVECNPTVGPPEYLTDISMVNFTCLMQQENQLLTVEQKRSENFSEESTDSGDDDDEIVANAQGSVYILNDGAWPSAHDLGLDDSQYAAVKLALTKKLALIQGPPGTGKTFIGFKIAQFLLANRSVWCGMQGVEVPVPEPVHGGAKVFLQSEVQLVQYRSPILVVCYTNHALDQFLEGVMRFSRDGIIRVGGRCQNTAFEPFLIKNVRNQPQYKTVVPGDVRYSMYKVGSLIKKMRSELECIAKNINLIDDNVLSADAMKQVASPVHQCSLFEYARKTFAEFQNKGDDHILNTWLFNQEVHDIVVAEASDAMHMPMSADTEEHQIDDQAYAVALEGFDRVIDSDNDEDLEGIEENPLPARIVKPFIRRSLVQVIQPKYAVLQKELQRATSKPQENVTNLWEMTKAQRLSLYAHWKENFVKQERKRVEGLEKQYSENKTRLKEMTAVRDYHIMQNAQIIGMTTTGAAKHQGILQQIQPKIVIVEEAAEVLEAHILTCLSPGTQHLILIGDHKQLRPNPSVYALARKYNLEVSLFERLVSNNFDHATLGRQHRMRPEIADTLMPHFYDGLQNDISVHNYADVYGIDGNILFIGHGNLEANHGDSRSHQNEFEAKFVVALANHLLLQGYNSSQITILVPYIGQMFMVKNMIKNDGRTMLAGIQVTCVDNFQGEENDIIILSMVRSNRNKKIGFLQTKNRVCVALSRAKMGLYCIGNFDLFARVSYLWQSINGVLKEKGILGRSIRLKCEVHNTVSLVSEPSEFYKYAPEGGCRIPCTFRLDCGHTCRKMCHPIDRDHKEYSCLQKCPRTCPGGHPCKFTCYKCQPECRPCEVPVMRDLPCGHSKKLRCFVDVNNYKCQEACIKILSCGHRCAEKCFNTTHTQKCGYLVQKPRSCGHTIKVRCHMDSEQIQCKELVKKEMPICGHRIDWACSDGNLIQMKCTHPCDAILACGHRCPGTCGRCCQARLHVQCDKPCDRILICGHSCPSKCCSACPPCRKPCENKCDHNSCGGVDNSKQKKGRKSKGVPVRTCGEKCPPCAEKCNIKCIHTACDQLCSEPCSTVPCNESCFELLNCNHPCMGLCGQPCPKICKFCKPDDEVFEIFLGREDEEDARFVELVDCGHRFEVRDLDQWMALDNGSGNDVDNQNTADFSTGSINPVSIGLKCCPKCKKPIRCTLRYVAFIKKALAQIELAKAKMHGQLDGSVQDVKQEIWDMLGIKLESNIENVDQHHIDAYLNGQIHEKYPLAKTGTTGLLFRFLNSILRFDTKTITTDLIARWKNTASWFRKLYTLKSNSMFRQMNSRKAPFEQCGPIVQSLVVMWRQMCTDTSGCQPGLIDSTTIGDIVHILETELARLGKWLMNRLSIYQRISFQEAQEFDMEIRRCQLLFDLGIFIASDESSFKTTSKSPDVDRLATMLKGHLYGKEPISEAMEKVLKSDLKDVFDKYKYSLGLSPTEKTAICRAMDLPKGHWYECKNGHVYAIGECGGAMEVSSCPECKATIGGTNHRVADGNRVATRMDGAIHAAWSEQANLANYDPDALQLD